jgi:hypothetical protein
LYRRLLRIKDRGLNITNAVRVIAETFREVANYNSTVGRELMVSILPRSAVPRVDSGRLLALNAPVNQDAPTFWTMTAQGDLRQYGPTMVMHGVVVSDLISHSGPGYVSGITVSTGTDQL